MKRKLLITSLIAALLLTAYSLYACLATRGLRIYLMGTTLGWVLAGSWQYTLAAALLLWIPGVVTAVRLLSGRKDRAVIAAAKPTATAGAPESEPVQPRRAGKPRKDKKAGKSQTVPGGSAGLIQPRRAGESAATELIQPRGESETQLPESGAAESAGTELIEPAAGPAATEPAPAPAGSAAPEAGPAAVWTPQAEEAASPDTELVPPAPPQKKAPAPPPAGIRRCVKCGHIVTGKRFCPQCGTKVEG